MQIDFTLQNIDDAASYFLKKIGQQKVIALHGQMGVGKTTLLYSIGKLLGVAEPISSPTFSIINQYTTTAGQLLYHLDLYRIKDVQEAIDAGVEDCLYSEQLCFVEWPEVLPTLLPSHTLHCYLSIIDECTRRLVIG